MMPFGYAVILERFPNAARYAFWSSQTQCVAAVNRWPTLSLSVTANAINVTTYPPIDTNRAQSPGAIWVLALHPRATEKRSTATLALGDSMQEMPPRIVAAHSDSSKAIRRYTKINSSGMSSTNPSRLWKTQTRSREAGRSSKGGCEHIGKD